MEFHEKLQELRKNRGLTQEELAELLYVSRAAISKWESGRGYPSIDSLKEISKYFSVSIDDLLSGEKLVFIAEKENKSNIQSMCELVLGIIDICYLMLVILPFYPNTVDGFVYSVNLFAYTQTTVLNRCIYWCLFVAMGLLGILELILTRFRNEKRNKILTNLSMILGSFVVLFLANTREAYAVTFTFLLLIIKTIILMNCMKIKRG